jgi:hypothetical protein
VNALALRRAKCLRRRHARLIGVEALRMVRPLLQRRPNARPCLEAIRFLNDENCALGARAPRETMPASTTNDSRQIRELIENWAVWRDALLMDRFRTVWHKDGQMWATWFQGTYEEFIQVTEEGYARGVRILHFLGGSSIDVTGNRAIAQTKMTISQRAPVEDVVCDVLCTGRFYDFLEKRRGKWGLVLRRLVYEKDRIDPVDPSVMLKLDQKLLDQFPIGYRHLAYLQTRIGYKVKVDMPGLDGPEVQELYAFGADWLKGKRKGHPGGWK